MARVVEHNQIPKPGALDAIWAALWRETPNADFFRTAAWLRNYWRFFGDSQRLRLLQVLNGGETIGLVPLVERREPTRLGPATVLTYPLQDWGSHFGPLGRPSSRILAEALAYLRSERQPRWDMLDLRWIPEPEIEAVESDMRGLRWNPHRGVWKLSNVADLPTTLAAYLAERPPKWRGELLRNRRRVMRVGRMEIEHYRPSSDAAALGEVARLDVFEDCLRVARRSWQGDSATGTTLSHSQIEPFLRACHLDAAGLGLLDVTLLRIDQRPVAFGYHYHAQGRVSAIRTGFDPDYRRLGVGAVAWSHVIENCIERGDRTLDLGPDSPHVKRHWRSRLESIGRLTVYRGWKGGLLRCKHTLARG